MEKTARRPRPLFLAPIALPVALFGHPKPDFGRTWPDVAEMGPLLRRFAPKSACSEIAKNREQTPRFFFKNPNFRESGFSQKNGKNRASAAAPLFGANRLACRPFCPPKTGLRPDLARCRRNGAYTKAIRPEIGSLGNRKKS